MCLYPKLIKNPKYKANKKNGGIIPAVFDVRTKVVPIECGKCMECKKRKSREWQIRLLEDVRHEKSFYGNLKDENIKLRWNSWLEKWKVKINVNDEESKQKLSNQMKLINPKYSLRE